MSATIVWSWIYISLLTPWATAQSASTPTSTTTCNLDDGRQVYVRYKPVATKQEKISNGKPWTPGGVPMTLFTGDPINSWGFPDSDWRVHRLLI